MALPSADTKGWGADVVQASTTRAAFSADPHARVVVIKNPSTNTVPVYLGGSDMTSANAATEGYPLEPGEVISFSDEEVGVLQVPLSYIVTAGTANFVVLQGNV